jgi:predicted PurR-regulated permease PerM
MDGGKGGGATRSEARDRFIGRVAIVAAAVIVVFLLWQIRSALILTFGGIVIAVVICSIADPLTRRGLPRTGAVLASIAAIAAIAAIFGWIAMPQLSAQASQLIDALPASVEELDRRLGGWFPENLELNSTLMGELAQHAARWSGMLLATLTSLFLVLALGAFLALNPGSYRDGTVRLLAPRHQDRVRTALDATGDKLKKWLLAKLAAMAVIGTLVTLATWLLGLTAPFALGLLAGVLAFVPILGPIAAAIPALLLALTVSPATVLWTGLAYFAIEQLESNLLLPLFEGEMADVPPALLIVSFSVVGLVFGLPGIIVTAPLTVAVMSLTRDLYVAPLNEPGKQSHEKEIA